MSFFRPEVIAAAQRWAETAIYGSATLALAAWAFDAAATTLWRVALVGLVLIIGGSLTRAAYLSAAAKARRAGPGVVLIDERRITYLGPDRGGFASLNGIRAVLVRAGPRGAAWLIAHDDDSGELLSIPAAAEGASRLIDAFAALPGFAAPAALSALGAEDGAERLIWRREDTGERGALAAGGSPP